jgi:hypothetical protein
MGANDYAQRLAAPADREALSSEMIKLRDPSRRAYSRGRRIKPRRPSGETVEASAPVARKPGFRISRAGWATLAAILLSAVIWAVVIVGVVVLARHNFVVHGR